MNSLRVKPCLNLPSPSITANRAFTNYLNTGLILVSFVLAFVLPFELFFFAYALLGPLHYLTEIGWLHRRNYFIPAGKGRSWLWVLAGAATIAWLTTGKQSSSALATVTLTAFFSSLVLMSIKDKRTRISLILTISIMVPLLVHANSGLITIAFYLTTLAHVFLFTALFMLLGSLKEKSLSSFVAVTTLLFCAVNLLFFPQGPVNYQIAPVFAKNAIAFGAIERTLSTHLGWSPSWEHSVQAMRFVAFAYTYHYLNWFSKTNVIAWHKMSRRGWFTVGLVYIAAVSLYAYDFKLGLQALFLLSIGHVFMEFPLNCFSIREIAKELSSAARGVEFTSSRVLQQAKVIETAPLGRSAR